jgi:putative transposase
VDSAYRGTATWAYIVWAWCVEVVRHAKGCFQVQAKRWIVERTLGWWNRARRLSKDYERTIESSAGFIQVAMIHVMLRRLAP